MSLLVLEQVSKRFTRRGRGGREQTALRDVRLQLDAGELIAVWGRRRSGRTTLLQVAVGVERPSDGAVRFGGIDLARRPMLGRPDGIAYVSTHFARVIGETVLEQVGAPVLGGHASMATAQSLAFRALRRVHAVDCADAAIAALDHDELIRVALARALVTDPRLIVLDEPTQDLRLAHDRDRTLELLRSLAEDDGTAVLMTVAEAAELAGADRALTIDHGALHGLTQPAMGQVVELRQSRS